MSNEVVPTKPARNWLWQPNLIVFISSGCIMILGCISETVSTNVRLR